MSERNSSSRRRRATESAPPETATATRSPARIELCFRIVFRRPSASTCTGKWYRKKGWRNDDARGGGVVCETVTTKGTKMPTKVHEENRVDGENRDEMLRVLGG